MRSMLLTYWEYNGKLSQVLRVGKPRWNCSRLILGSETSGRLLLNSPRDCVKALTVPVRVSLDSTDTSPEQGARSPNRRTSHTQTTGLATGISCAHVGAPWPNSNFRNFSWLILLELDGHGRIHDSAELLKVCEERFRLKIKTNPMILLHATRSFKFFTLDLFGPLTRTTMCI